MVSRIEREKRLESGTPDDTFERKSAKGSAAAGSRDHNMRGGEDGSACGVVIFEGKMTKSLRQLGVASEFPETARLIRPRPRA